MLNLKKVLYQWKYYNYNIIIIIMLCSSTLILTNVPYCLKNMFSIYSNKKTHPIQTPLYPLWLWFEQAWTRTPWGVSTVKKWIYLVSLTQRIPELRAFFSLKKKEITIIYSYKRNIFLTFTYINENLPNILQFIFGYKIRFD